MELREVDEHLWTADSVLRMPVVHLPLRMTVIRIGDALSIHSPIALDDALTGEIDAQRLEGARDGSRETGT